MNAAQHQSAHLFSSRRRTFTIVNDRSHKHKPPSRLLLKSTPQSSSASAASLSAPAEINKPIVVVGSANADIYVEIDRLPKKGETVSARNGVTLAGGKGANQACCGGRLAHPTYFVGQIGEDAHGRLIEDALRRGGVRLDYLARVPSAPTGFAVVMLEPDGQNSIIIIGGANMCGWPEEVGRKDLELVRSAGLVLLQREIPDHINIQVATASQNAGVPVILDVGGVEAPIPVGLLNVIDILSPNETELQRLTGMPTDTFEQISQAALKCHEMGVKKILLKLGSKGSALCVAGEEMIRQPAIPVSEVVDTTGAGDTFTAAFGVALVEGLTMDACLEFAAAAASLCIEVKGTIPSMPDRKAVVERLQRLFNYR
ncbi:hypothetical protein HPP92_024629 [Vanilla planifolia]|uniref:Ribokinase n=1 Tax=Vanilla planifolia TaxID=51239 RepID=A0A835PSG8_VANPL|nr:hypothetical protein HPP92_024629 [Vanilla planifolia]